MAKIHYDVPPKYMIRYRDHTDEQWEAARARVSICGRAAIETTKKIEDVDCRACIKVYEYRKKLGDI